MEKIEQGMPIVGKFAIFNRVMREAMGGKVTFVQRIKGGSGTGHVREKASGRE